MILPIVEISSNRDQSEQDYPLLKNSLLTGIATAKFLGPQLGISCAVANYAIAKLNRDNEQRDWFPHETSLQELGSYWNNAYPFFTLHFIIGGLSKIGKYFFDPLENSSEQVAVTWLKSSFESPWKALTAIFYVSVVGPIIEEVVFRGFLQEKIRDVQVFLFGNLADEGILKTSRIALQAIAFGLAHYHPLQGTLNIFICLFTGAMGYMAGTYKESTGDLWQSSGLHMHLNGSVCARLAFFGS